MAKRKLIWQIYGPYLLITMASIAIIAWFSWHWFEQFYIDQTANVLKVRAGLIGIQLKDQLADGQLDINEADIAELGRVTDMRITVIVVDGTVVADSHEDPAQMENHGARPEFRTALESGFGSSIRFSHTLGQKLMYGAVPVVVEGQPLAVVRASAVMTDLQDAAYSAYWGIFIVGGIIAVTAACVSLWVSRRITRPLVEMTGTAELFAAGELEHRIQPGNSIELASLAGAMNEMARLLHERLLTVTSQRDELEAILASMAEGVLAVDKYLRLVTINDAAARFLGINTQKSAGKSIYEAIRNPQVHDFVKETLAAGGITKTDILLTDGGKRYFQMRGMSLARQSQSPVRAVIVLNDMTSIHKLETVRQDFVANVSHELKTPITSIKGFVETLLADDSTDRQQSRRFLEIISRHADRLNSIINDLLSLSRLEQEKQVQELAFVRHPLAPLLENIIQASRMSAGKNISIGLDCPDDISVRANGPLLEQALANLINNAVKYSDQTGRIEVTARKSQDGYVDISVQDNGCGIHQKDQQRIFERFYVVDKARSRKLGGTGLGLAIVKHICNVHGGTVSVQSQIGKGSTFTIRIPAVG